MVHGSGGCESGSSVNLKDYYHILRISKYASAEEIKRSYRRLASRYHPDVNTSPDAHYVFIEIHEAYEVLSDPHQKWIYDQRFAQPEIYTSQPIFTETKAQQDRRRRHGKKETPEERLAKQLFAIQRNRSFNKKMKALSVISLLFALSIFIDHYLPTHNHVELAYYSFDPHSALRHSDVTYAIMAEEKPISMYAIGKVESSHGMGENVAMFSETRIWRVLAGVQLKDVLFEPVNGLYPLMLIYGLICVACLTVLFYKLERDLFYPTFVTFFCNIFVLAFMVLKITS